VKGQGGGVWGGWGIGRGVRGQGGGVWGVCDGRGDAGYRMGVRMEGSCLKKASVYPLYYILSSALMFSLLESIVRETMVYKYKYIFRHFRPKQIF